MRRLKGKYHPTKHPLGPLRGVTEVIRYGEGIFDKDTVIFDCGHKGTRSVGSVRGRCKKCVPERSREG